MKDDSVYSKWSAQIDLAIRKHAASSSTEEKKDIRQDVLLAFVEAEGAILELDVHDEKRARAYAYVVARNAVINHVTSSTEKVSRMCVSLDDPRTHVEFWPGVATKTPSIDISRALESLPEDEQFVIRGLYFEGRTEGQIAESLGKTREGVRWKKKQGLKELKRLLKN